MVGLAELIEMLRLSDLRICWVLQAFWIAGILPIMIASIPSSRFTSFHRLLLGFARRGKILPPSSSQKFTVPQKFFLHFYIFSMVWTTTLLALTWQYACKVAPLKYEAHYLLGGHDRILDIDGTFLGYLEPFTKLEWYTWTGAALFIWGWIHQQNCHTIFGSLRRDKNYQNKHVIPSGDWFEYVSCPHYLAEMVIYAGIVIASGGTDFTIWLAFAFTVVNLSFAAGETHKWYLEKFEDYPRDRKAVIPFIY